ncbi:unnamed protein product [Bursaphelenchus xylophilus]|uniref:Signal peptidase complex subunit 3 n=1 Tax=Bursaphelenchus xylophilus TaxID=6326 RepID=A0A1I7SFT1_BURXY|nr:unnamed protein product [Bursaphelenchus xylophilus]CAG9113062.1 unnamed protein product [Bursaphelenchus xylophilus]
MHSFLSRLNGLFAFMCSVLAAATFLVFLQTLFVNYTVPVQLEVENIRLKPVHDYASLNGRSDLASATFSMSADLTPVFNWNVKQIYAWLQADYETEERPTNQIVLWDKYFFRFGNNVLNEERIKPYYYFQDDGLNLRNKNVTFSLHWTVVPNAGWMRNVQGEGVKSVVFPDTYKW